MRPPIRSGSWRKRAAGVSAAAWCTLAAPLAAAQGSLAHLSLEELSNLEITSASKRPERLADVPASVYVITADEIRRSGVTTLPEALRLAPNLFVASMSASDYSVSARGMADTASNKMLVLIDGRSVYTPLFGGVFWDVQHVMLEDVDRIEVISGPGGTLWGLNAVNGVINVITRPATQTRGTLVSAGGGNAEVTAGVRLGLGTDDQQAVRLYAQHVSRMNTQTSTGADVDDASRFDKLGVRADWTSGADTVSMMGEMYTGRMHQPLPGSLTITGVELDLDTIAVSGGHLYGLWTRQLDAQSSLQLQAYYDRTERTVPPTFSNKLDIFDVQLTHSMRWGDIHSLVWGGQYRRAQDRTVNSPYAEFLPARVTHDWPSVFAQYEVEVLRTVTLTLGARVEHNDYTGYDALPNARLAWKPANGHLLWTALSHAVRAPARLDRDTYIPWPDAIPFPNHPKYILNGGVRVESETANVLELGYRGQPTPDTTLSASVYRARYERLQTQETAATQDHVYYASGMHGSTSGFEAWGTWQAGRTFMMRAGYSYLNQDFALYDWSNDVNAVADTEGRNPGSRWLLRASLDLPQRMELDATVRYVSSLALPEVPSYTALDMRWGWRFNPGWEFSIAGQNLFGGAHGEFTPRETRSEFGPSVFVKLAGRF